MSNLFEAIRESMKDPLHAQNEETAERLRDLHALYRSINKFAAPIIYQFSHAIGAKSYYYLLDDAVLSKDIGSFPPEEQIRLLSGEEPLWVITNQKKFVRPDLCSDENDRIILIRWEGTNKHDGEFSVIYKSGGEKIIPWDKDTCFAKSYYWSPGLLKEAKGTEKGLISLFHDLYNDLKYDIDKYFGK